MSELTGSLRQHAAMYRITDPETARAHHAVHWILARRMRDRLASGELTMEDLWAMWERGELPRGVRVPDLAAWKVAIAHQLPHVPFETPHDDEDDVTANVIQWPGASSHVRSRTALTDEDLDLLTHPSQDAGFFAITSRVAAHLVTHEPEEWAEAIGEGRAVSRILRTVMEPFDGNDPATAPARLHDSCTVGNRWLAGDELMSAWARGGRTSDQEPA